MIKKTEKSSESSDSPRLYAHLFITFILKESLPQNTKPHETTSFPYNITCLVMPHQLLYDISIKNISCRPKSKWHIWGHVSSQNLSKKYVHSRCAPFCCTTLHTSNRNFELCYVGTQNEMHKMT